jgi:hypothetical protein
VIILCFVRRERRICMAPASNQSRTAKLGYQNPECYARALGGCCAAVDGEHAISRTLLEALLARTRLSLPVTWPGRKTDPYRLQIDWVLEKIGGLMAAELELLSTMPLRGR